MVISKMLHVQPCYRNLIDLTWNDPNVVFRCIQINADTAWHCMMGNHFNEQDSEFHGVKASVFVCSGWFCPVLAGLKQECQLFKHKPMKTHACGLRVCPDPAVLCSRMRYQLFEMCSVSGHIKLSVVAISACTSSLIPHMGARSPPPPTFLVCVG